MKKILLVFFIVAIMLLCPPIPLTNGNEGKNYFDEIRYQVGFCESGNKHDGVWGDGGLAYGKYQFHSRTFDWMKDLAGKPELKRENLEDQEWLFKWAIKNGYGDHWTCYTKIMKRKTDT